RSRCIGAGLAEIMAVAPSAPMPLVFGPFACLAGDGLACRCRLLRAGGRAILTMMTVAIMARWPAFVGTSTGPPDLDHFRRSSYLGHGFRGDGVRCRGAGIRSHAGVRGDGFAGNSRFACDLGQRLVDGLILKLVF